MIPAPPQGKSGRNVARIAAPLLWRVKPIEIGRRYIGSTPGYIASEQKYIAGLHGALGTLEMNPGGGVSI
jgi:hypothetical protein